MTALSAVFKEAVLLVVAAFLLGCGAEESSLDYEEKLGEDVSYFEGFRQSDEAFEEYLDIDEGRMKYTVNSDSALYYYNLGWHQIMDEGRYGKAEISYRKSLGFDPDFLIGQAVLGRLTLDNGERARIYENVERKRGSLPMDEEELLGVYHDFVHYTNRREAGDTTARAFVRKALINAEEVFRTIVHKYPEEPWMKSEYVEFLNSNHGPAIALDSLAVLTRDRHAYNPFLSGFQASLEAELGNFEKATKIAEKLEIRTVDKTEPKPWAVFADIYFQMDSLSLAKKYVDRAVILDSRNLDATRLQAKINAALKVAE